MKFIHMTNHYCIHWQKGENLGFSFEFSIEMIAIVSLFEKFKQGVQVPVHVMLTTNGEKHL